MARATTKKTTKAKATTKKAAPAKANASWTIMVYLAGDNNLDGAGATDLMEMKKVGSSAAINVVAQFDRSGNKGTTKRYMLRKSTTLQADVVGDLGETNTGDPAVLKDFLTWGIKTYPAQHYLAVLWNHGAGWDDSNLYAGDYFSGEAPPAVVHKGYTLDAKGSIATRAAPARKKQAAPGSRRRSRKWRSRAPSVLTIRPRITSTTPR